MFVINLDAVVVLRTFRVVQKLELFLQRVRIGTIIRCTSLSLTESFPPFMTFLFDSLIPSPLRYHRLGIGTQTNVNRMGYIMILDS